MKKIIISLALVATTTTYAFNFDVFPGMYQKVQLEDHNIGCPATVNVLRELNSIYVYSLDDDIDIFPPTIDLDVLDKGKIKFNSPGIKGTLNTYVSISDERNLVLRKYVRKIFQKNKSIFSFFQSKSGDEFIYKQIGNIETLECYYEKRD
ncbi:hypothetical protein A9Q84_15485 [Halobacteriovorax marinus]|uniref:Secreted protein n=1 Tax=Halobacteriovorax marinus TaxID=97084 RepID=A0A1Y5F3S9_9BACT|nr:hypothetical protein A9Q84_15485 [Halobacteriovorax marinus]